MNNLKMQYDFEFLILIFTSLIRFLPVIKYYKYSIHNDMLQENVYNKCLKYASFFLEHIQHLIKYLLIPKLIHVLMDVHNLIQK